LIGFLIVCFRVGQVEKNELEKGKINKKNRLGNSKQSHKSINKGKKIDLKQWWRLENKIIDVNKSRSRLWMAFREHKSCSTKLET
jgi:hypothetical protein